MALLTLAALKKRLSITDTDDDADLSGVVAASIAAVESFLGYDPEVVAVTEYCNPNAGDVILLRNAPPGSPVTITSLWEDWSNPPTFDSTTLLTADTDYQQERTGSAAIRRLNRNWPVQVRREYDRLGRMLSPTTGTVKVTYTLDTANVLAVAKRAALMEAMAQWNYTTGGMGIGLVTSDSMDGASLSINTNVIQSKDTSTLFLSPAPPVLLKSFRKPLIGG